MAMTPEVSDLVNKIKTEQSANKMRGYIADGLKSTNEKAVNTDGRQDLLRSDFVSLGNQFKDVIDSTTGKDVISAPEIIAARSGEIDLNARLTKNEQETTAQFQQIVINIRDFGAVGDGVTDDTVAIKDAVNSLKKGDKLLIPAGIFKNSGVSIPARGVEVEFRGELLYSGVAEKPAFTVGGYFITLINPKINRLYTGLGVAKDDLVGIGIDVANAKNCTIIKPEVEGFKYGIALHDKIGTGSAYLTIYEPYLTNNLIGYKCLIDTAGGWTNESKMYGGRITLDISGYSDITGSAYFDLLGDVHRFYGVCAEGKPERKVKGNFDESTFDGCRFEQTNGEIDIEINGNGNSFIRNRDWENVYKNNGVSNVILSRWYSYFGNPVIQPIKQFKSTISDSILRPNADHVHYLIDCSINKTDVSFTMSTLKNGTIFTFKKIDSTSNEVNIGAVNVDNTHVNPRLTRQNETIKLMVLDGKFILLDNENYSFNLGFNHVTYGLGMKRKITPENANYMRFESEICVESGTTGSFSGVIANGISGHDRVTLTGDTSRMTKDSWITLIGANYYVVNWDSTTKIATLKTGLNQTISNVVLERKNPVFAYCEPIVYRQSVVPTSGTWKQGDVVYNSKPAINGEIGWVCITSGNPGTWKQFGMIQA